MEEWDEAVIIAADELTPFVVSGFYAFQALSASRCRPYDISRGRHQPGGSSCGYEDQ
ncbi:MAG: hypothetical protein KL787_02420 [Taibaiella sp.]|nr:hypothetical protein [Taibaiella sp.]